MKIFKRLTCSHKYNVYSVRGIYRQYDSLFPKKYIDTHIHAMCLSCDKRVTLKFGMAVKNQVIIDTINAKGWTYSGGTAT